MFDGEIKVGDKVKLFNDHIMEITKVINDESGECFEACDLANGIPNSFLRDSIIEKV